MRNYFTMPVIACALVLTALSAQAQRKSTLLDKGWEFSHADSDERQWTPVTIPHDWAITGPFDINNDLQIVAVEQNGETEKTLKTGRTGGLPFIGKGEYRRTFEVADTAGKNITLLFDGAMSNAHVSVNGREVAFWPYGYNTFYADVTDAVKPGENDLFVSLQNFDKQSRWYAGAGLYRNVHLVETDKIHVPVWGTYVTTPYVSPEYASVNLKTEIEGAAKGEDVEVSTRIFDPEGKVVAMNKSVHATHGQPEVQNFIVDNPLLWSPETPWLYTAVTTLSVDGQPVDEYSTRFGIRKLEYIPEKGFFLNGQSTKFRGVCNHHDLGPLGAAINKSALRHQIELLKDMGANAIRTSHNMPAPELVELCDEMGMMLMVEPFDDWNHWPKSPNGYGAIFEEWAERDVTNMVKHFRNNPSVVMWSIGNEVPSQGSTEGVPVLTMLQNLVHQLDPTRPVTCGMDNIRVVLDNGFASALDIPGFNYKPQYYDEAFRRLPQKLILGSETASTFSSRGSYYWPVIYRGQEMVYHPDNQSSSYDNENASWSNTPDIDFMMDDDREWMIGQFVWTGFDYLGEPTPYDTDAWPSHSSVFGIFDLASLPKDRFYLYRSQWNKDDHTLHILPHWTHPGREGEVTPVYVYTDYPAAELFVNGVSQGMQRKLSREQYEASTDSLALQRRYRLMWNDVVYEPGELRVVAYDAEDNPAEERVVKTAGKPYRLIATANRQKLEADGKDLAYITVSAVDKAGNLCPWDDSMVKFKVSGAGRFKATANGDPTSLDPFQKPQMRLFHGMLTAIVESGENPGTINFEATAKGLKPAKIAIETE